MPSFDIVSEVDLHEVNNAVDQSNREITNRFDFKGSDAKFALKDTKVSLTSPNDFQLQQMRDILLTKFSKRNIDVRSLEIGDPVINLQQARQEVTVKQGIDQDNAKKIVKLLKDSKMKVQAAIQGDKVRVTGKKRDDLQEAIAFLRAAEEVALPLQFDNFRD